MREDVFTDGNIRSFSPASLSEIRSSVPASQRYNAVRPEVTPDIFHTTRDASPSVLYDLFGSGRICRFERSAGDTDQDLGLSRTDIAIPCESGAAISSDRVAQCAA